MTKPEISKLHVIQQLNEGKLTRRQAGELLHLSIRQIQRLHNRYRHQGFSFNYVRLLTDSPSQYYLPHS